MSLIKPLLFCGAVESAPIIIDILWLSLGVSLPLQISYMITGRIRQSQGRKAREKSKGFVSQVGMFSSIVQPDSRATSPHQPAFLVHPRSQWSLDSCRRPPPPRPAAARPRASFLGVRGKYAVCFLVDMSHCPAPTALSQVFRRPNLGVRPVDLLYRAPVGVPVEQDLQHQRS